MEEIVGVTAVGGLVAFALVKAYSGKVLTQLRADCARVITQERHLRQQREHEESQLESAEARMEQLELDKTKMTTELETITSDIARVSLELDRLKGTDEDEDDAAVQP